MKEKEEISDYRRRTTTGKSLILDRRRQGRLLLLFWPW
jgi:hypothetical protein